MKNHLTYLLLSISLLIGEFSFGQTYGNEWIDYTQQYFRFEVVTTGLHRINQSDLVNAGIPVTSFTSENIQLFGREREIPIWVEDGGDSQLDPGDYILFYAEKNDGWLDSTLYLDPNSIANPAYSLYNDTINYFFTWNASTSNLRYQEETDVNFGSYASVAPFIIQKTEVNYNTAFHEGEKNSLVAGSFYTRGKGWGASHVNGAAGYTANLTISTPDPFMGVGAPLPVFRGLSVSTSDASFTDTGNHHLIWDIGSLQTELMDSIFEGYQQIICNTTFSSALLSDGNTPLRWRIIGDQGAVTDYQAYNYYSVEYPRNPDLSGANNALFKVQNDPQGKIRLDISNAGYSTPIMFVDGDTPRMIPFEPNGGVHSALIPNSGNGVDQTVCYFDLSLAIPIFNFTAINGTGFFTDYVAVPSAIDSVLLMIYPDDLASVTMDYAAFRGSAAGGGFNVLPVNVEELYWQFGGGIEKHVNGVRRFVHYIYNNAAQKPSGLFLVGKGIREANSNETTSDGAGTRKNSSRFHQSFIPSFGYPSSDVLITAGLEGPYEWAPLVPTGRISARTNTELSEYLDKVIAFEGQIDSLDVYDTPSKDWQKKILHFVGGSDAQQIAQFSGYVDGWEAYIESEQFAGLVTKYVNDSSDPLNPSELAGVMDQINDGVALMSYFGHASATTSGFEINLDEVANWSNTGRYPLMLVNSCYNGNIFQETQSKSEEFVQIANRGAIGYIASVSVGVDYYLNVYSKKFYQHLSLNDYAANIGSLMQFTIRDLEVPGNLYQESTCAQMVLNGDPMLRLYPHTKPEIELLPEYVSFSPTDLDLTVDSITMSIALKNLGRSVTTPITLEITRNFPATNVDSVYTFNIPYLHYADTIAFKMPLQPNIGVGLNQFTVKVDLPSIVDEVYDEINNNQITKTLFINVDGIVPVIPYEFAVVPNDSVTVKGSTVNPIADFKTYRFEIDTTDLFDSPEHRYALVSGLGGVKEVNPSQWIDVSSGLPDPLVCEDSMVYFWRCAVDSVTPDWRESSFQYIVGREGWGQDHFFQFKKNGFSNIDYDRPTRKRYFSPIDKLLQCNVGSSTTSPAFYFENNYSIDAVQEEYGIGAGASRKLHVAVIDGCSLEAWGTKFTDASGTQNPDNNFGNYNNEQLWVWKSFHFLQSDATQLANFQNFVLNEVPDSSYLLIYTPIEAKYTDWNALDSANMYATFAALGSDSIIAGRPNRPFIFFCKKGDPSSVIEELVTVTGGTAYLEVGMTGCDNLGAETSTLIGPAAQWHNVYWQQDPEESPTADSTNLRIRAYNEYGVLSMTIDTLFTLNDSLLNLNSMVDASVYPFIDLSAHYTDSVDFTPAQVDSWHVLYSPLPEAAIDGTSAYLWSQSSDTLSEGQTVDFAVDIKNIFSVDMDSLLVSYWIEDVNQIKHAIGYPRQDSLRVGETMRDTITIPTVGLDGVNSLWVEVNPYVNGSYIITDQPEQQHFNNLLQLPFYVNSDDKNPILDVTFNGDHLLNGDIIDPSSEILITLKDDNEYLIMDNVSDTALFGIYLTDPLGNQKKINFVDGGGQTVMQWIPAEPQNKRFKIIWPAEFTMDGTYILYVQGTDRSGNLSGDLEYRVSFDIIHESTITNMMNYPNPFSTSTRFVFTLTGTEEPDDIIIQIMSVSGRVVREITEDELGPIQIGRNITEYAWDGTDEFGDPLANGVYLYTVRARIGGEDIKHRESGADQFFEKSFGKMYLMR